MTDKEKLQARLDQAENALHLLMTGQQQVEVQYDGHTVKYTSATSSGLRAYITELEVKLGKKKGRSKAILTRF